MECSAFASSDGTGGVAGAAGGGGVAFVAAWPRASRAASPASAPAKAPNIVPSPSTRTIRRRSGEGTLGFSGAGRGSLMASRRLQEAREPGVHLAVPEDRVARLEHPVVLVREVDQARGDALPLEHVVALETLVDGHAVVELAVHDEHRRGQPVREARR